MRKIQLLPVLWLIAATPAFALSGNPYLAPGKLDMIHLIAPPPAPGSEVQRLDIENNLTVQRQRNATEESRALADAEVSIFRFADVLGPNFAAKKVPGVAAFFNKVARETGVQTNLLKDCWERPRPFVASGDVHPIRTMTESVTNRAGTTNTAPHDASVPCHPLEPTQTYSYSYPSGHSTFGVMTAILLSQMVPEKREALYARAWEYGHNRVVAGVHFQSDVEGGRITATVLAAMMMESLDFKTDLAAAKTELRQALGLPAER